MNSPTCSSSEPAFMYDSRPSIQRWSVMRYIFNYSAFLSNISCSGRSVAVAVPSNFEASIISTRSVAGCIDFCREDCKVEKLLKIIPNSSSCLVYELVNSINSCCIFLPDISSAFTCPKADLTCSLHYGNWDTACALMYSIRRFVECIQLVPAQDVPFALILKYVAKMIHLS